jgi:hypothetical protein
MFGHEKKLLVHANAGRTHRTGRARRLVVHALDPGSLRVSESERDAIDEENRTKMLADFPASADAAA